MTYEIHHGDCIEVMRSLPDNSVDSIVTDPPYELSNDGKSSPNRVFAEMVLPKDSHLKALACGEDVLSLFVGEVSKLGGVRLVPGPAPTVPVGSVALDNQPAVGNNDVVDGVKRPVSVSRDATGVDVEAESPIHLGSFALKLADPSQLIEVVGKLGACFEAGRLGVGLGVVAAGFPAPQPGLSGHGVHGGVGFRDRALADLVGAFRGAGRGSVLSLDLGGGSVEQFTADGARVFAAILLSSGAELVRASPPASGLPAVLESRRISVIDDAANRAFTFDLILHTQSISSLGFMGKAWDGSKIAYDVALWREALRVLKPGGHLLAFGGSRTWHRLAVAVEDAGFEIRDSIAWLYGSGFPKSLDVSKAIDKAAGAEREVIGTAKRSQNRSEGWDRPWMREQMEAVGGSGMAEHNITAPATEAAQAWQGWGTALKPAFEPVVMGRKPLIGTVAANVQQHGTGALNIDATRIGTEQRTYSVTGAPGGNAVRLTGGDGRDAENARTYGEASKAKPPVTVAGRWPANVVLDETTAPLLDAQSGPTGSWSGRARAAGAVGEGMFGTRIEGSHYGDFGGGASRFFYVAKAPKRERPVVDGVAHATVKPLTLMRWLVRLVTPEGGTVLEPFAGSGTTVEACILEGFDCIAIEREAEYLPLIQARVDRQVA